MKGRFVDFSPALTVVVGGVPQVQGVALRGMLATGGAWMSAWVLRAGALRHESGSAQPFGLRATLVGWTVGAVRVVPPPPLF